MSQLSRNFRGGKRFHVILKLGILGSAEFRCVATFFGKIEFWMGLLDYLFPVHKRFIKCDHLTIKNELH